LQVNTVLNTRVTVATGIGITDTPQEILNKTILRKTHNLWDQINYKCFHDCCWSM